MIMFYFYF